MADLLELECPECDALLELDAGFAGGVCRCSNCGVLMTVPAEASAERAERLSRPAAPGAPGTPGAGRPDAPTSGRPGRPSTASGTYVTDTGRVVHVGAETRIPVAASRKRAVIRFTTAALFIGLVLGIVALAGVAVLIIVKPAPDPKDIQASVLTLQQFDYDRDQNPWLIDKPNVLGMSLGAKTVVIVDAPESETIGLGGQADWLALAKSAIATGMTRADSLARINLLYATGGDVESLAGSLRDIGSLSESQLTHFQEPFKATGDPSLRRAVEVAIEMEPTQLLILTARRVADDEVQHLQNLLAGQPELVLDLLSINASSISLEQLAESTGGRVEFLSLRRLEDWHAEAQQAQTPR